MSIHVPITLAHGDGIGPEIMQGSRHSIPEAGGRSDLEIGKTEALRSHNGAAGYTLSPGY
jgi:isocitrate/isopropylmalate dehydrogenase